MSFRWHRSDDVAVVESPDRFAVLNLQRLADPPVVLEGPAAAIWQVLDRDLTEDEVVDAMIARYEAAEDVVRPQVRAFLEDLEQRGLAERGEDGSG